MVRLTHAGLVSVVVVNYDGADDTLACIESLRQLEIDEDRLEIIVVDNGSPGDDVERLRAAGSDVHVVALRKNVGFAAGCNAGVARATGEYLAFLNNDARPHPHWLAAAINPLEYDGSIACVASKVLGWDGSTVDFVGAALAYYGHGFKVDFGNAASPMENTACDVLFASGAAMVIRAEVFRRVGGFDERYFMFFEDVDLGWRLWLLGYRVRYVPGSIAYHRHHATAARFGAWREHYLLAPGGAAAGRPARDRARRRRPAHARPRERFQRARGQAPHRQPPDRRTDLRDRRVHRRAAVARRDPARAAGVTAAA
jgi:GT2 family glycosyltransferase